MNLNLPNPFNTRLRTHPETNIEDLNAFVSVLALSNAISSQKTKIDLDLIDISQN